MDWSHAVAHGLIDAPGTGRVVLGPPDACFITCFIAPLSCSLYEAYIRGRPRNPGLPDCRDTALKLAVEKQENPGSSSREAARIPDW
jgi:hypothetical protein